MRANERWLLALGFWLSAITMPELPEVETIRRRLRSLILGRKVARVEVFERRLRIPVSPRFSHQLQGKTILDVERRGKYLLIILEPDQVWISHLGMSGKLIYVKPSRPREKHDHIIVTLDDGRQLRYHDPRRFGLSMLRAREDISSLPQFGDLGPEPFDPRYCGPYLHTLLRGSRRRIRDLLIDQSVVAGLGNIYANEVLFRAGIRPTNRGWRLGRSAAERIAVFTPEVLLEAIQWRGTSFLSFRDGEDRRGEFQYHLRVFDREGKPCVVCASKIKRVSLGNRSAYYCPKCQV